ncbi:hypothetical protein DFJ58DRAFT_848664 [Suillus subalutaceus]|uniref:uncharacterized protein n=1 Tax=Suillus subalutaceus TaxID=48586 RepID=UPI001B87E699|nr:uncharacterized protein DFJ58DRAFT_848664 [Suillus subalutaceus]KAG1829567.1 hypothetical protein DFJ58DRAFT_848664 [Suillus subalutaceus]
MWLVEADKAKSCFRNLYYQASRLQIAHQRGAWSLAISSREVVLSLHIGIFSINARQWWGHQYHSIGDWMMVSFLHKDLAIYVHEIKKKKRCSILVLKIQCILDVPYGQGGLPSYLSTLDSGITNGWNQTTVDCPIGDKVHPDNFIVHSWSLLHGPAYWTNPHHDSDGSVTFVQIETGEKKWGLFKPIHEDTITRTNLSNIALTLTDLYRNRENIQENWHGEIVTLLPGDMLIQPAGQFHAVYTPVASFATGGHFYNYECMHLTELSRYIDHKQGKILTNQVHAHSLETFQRMVINLPRISRRVKLYNRPLIALCTMVLECDKYVAAGTEKPKVRSSTTQPAHDIANAIIKHFWKDLKTATKTYRKKQTDGSNNQMHPGEPISREELLTCLKRFTTLGLYGRSDFGASSDLLDSCLFNIDIDMATELNLNVAFRNACLSTNIDLLNESDMTHMSGCKALYLDGYTGVFTIYGHGKSNSDAQHSHEYVSRPNMHIEYCLEALVSMKGFLPDKSLPAVALAAKLMAEKFGSV